MRFLTSIQARLSNKTPVTAGAAGKAAAAKLAAQLKKAKVPVTSTFVDEDQDPDELYHCIQVPVIPGIDAKALFAAFSKILNSPINKNTVSGMGDYQWDLKNKFMNFNVSFYYEGYDAVIVRVHEPVEA